MEQQLPFITPELPGVGGQLKAQPEHFVVEELPLYMPEGQGEHVYLNLTRQGMTTRQVVDGMAKVLGINAKDVGTAGLKDKWALTTQTFSVQIGGADPDELAAMIQGGMDVRVNWADRHRNKLKTGHLLGNRFGIFLAVETPGALEQAQAVARELTLRGLPNFFGPQRFGRQGDNVERGRAIIGGARPPKEKWLRKLLLSAYQSQLFNQWLALRMADGLFGRLLPGDVAKKTDTGGLFIVEDVDAEQMRMDNGEITYTGPIFGGKMKWAQAEAGERERAILDADTVDEAALKKAGLDGSRRPARLVPDGLVVEQGQGGLWFRFALPKGSYATVVLREFMKNEPTTAELD